MQKPGRIKSELLFLILSVKSGGSFFSGGQMGVNTSDATLKPGIFFLYIINMPSAKTKMP